MELRILVYIILKYFGSILIFFSLIFIKLRHNFTLAIMSIVINYNYIPTVELTTMYIS